MPGPEPALPVLVADAMLHHPKVWPAEVTVADLWGAFRDDHVHAALVVDGETLLAVVTRPDIAACPGTEPARRHGRLGERVITPDADLARVWARMTRERVRRLAVTDHDDTLLGLLCLKRSGRGFCSDADVAARAAEQCPDVLRWRGWPRPTAPTSCCSPTAPSSSPRSSSPPSAAASTATPTP